MKVRMLLFFIGMALFTSCSTVTVFQGTVWYGAKDLYEENKYNIYSNAISGIVTVESKTNGAVNIAADGSYTLAIEEDFYLGEPAEKYYTIEAYSGGTKGVVILRAKPGEARYLDIVLGTVIGEEK